MANGSAAVVGAQGWGRWGLGAVLLLAATHHGPAAAANLEVFARSFDTRGPQVVCNDFFCNSVTVIPPANVVDSRSYARIEELPTWTPALRHNWQRLSAFSQIGEATAKARLAHRNSVDLFSIQRAFDPTGRLDLSVQFIDVTPVPEPDTAGLLLAGGLGMAARLRQRKPRQLARVALVPPWTGRRTPACPGTGPTPQCPKDVAVIRGRCWPILAALALATTVQPARADLKLESLHLRAWVQLAEPDMTLSGPSETTWTMGRPPGPVTVVKAARGESLAAAARQTPDGFFHAVTTLEQDWSDRTGPHTVAAGTTHESLFTTNRRDTPLVLDFLFLGSRLEAGSYYGYGVMDAQAQLMIRAGIGNSAMPGLTKYWGFDDRLVLGGGGGFQVQQTNNVDINGIGLPTVQAASGWREMVVTGQINRLAFSATLDFGLLQPGEYFALHYASAVRIVSDTPYATTGRAEVIDPFSLRDDPPLQLSLRGVTLPAPVGVVPEPGSWALLLGGLGALAARRRLRKAWPVLGLPLGLALCAAGAAQATATAQASSAVFERGPFEQIDADQPLFAAVALSGAGALNTGPGDGNFLATAAADLRRGTLRASAWSNTIGQGLTLSSGSATLDETLSFDNTEDFTLTMELAVHGQFNGLGYVVGEVSNGLQLGGDGLSTRMAWDTGVHGLPSVPVRLTQVLGGPSATRRVELRSNLAANTLLVLGVDTVVWPGRVLGVRAWMGAAAWAPDNSFSNVSFGNTAQLRLQLPDGVRMQSASGQFLSLPPQPVPEPGTLALWAAGLLLLPAWWRSRRQPRRQGVQARAAAGAAVLLASGLAPAAQAATVLDYPVSFGNFYGDQPGVLDVHHRVTHLGSNIDGLQWWARGYDDLNGVAWGTYNSAGTLGHVDLRVLDGQPLRLDGFRLGSWAGAEGKLETVSVTAIGSNQPAWQFTGLIGVGNLANSFQLGLVSPTGFTITWTNPWWTAIDDIRLQTSAVPELAGAWLLLAGLPWLWARQRRHAGPQTPR